jgi:site-specific DNA recombinase
MPNHDTFKDVFDSLATDGCIGDPHGRLAYAYIRVSDSDQAEDGRSGLPRQIGHVHEIAQKRGYKIPWDFVFADDHTGFEFEGRPALTQLRREYKSHKARAEAVVMEHLDRLSRNADWHQGFLLDEMRRHKIEAVFWNAFGSLIERAVMGAIAQEGMEQAKRRMMEGNLHKARSGRVTARTPAYGYKLVDANGNEGAAAKKESYYAIREEEAAIVRLIFRRLLNGDPMRKIALELEMAGVKPPKQSKHWEAVYVRLIIVNEIYKGDFYAHRWHHTVVQKPSEDGLSTRAVKCKIEYPREEWIHVPVPPIVTPEEWEAANRMLAQNKKTARRNAKDPYLLTGLVRCAHCGWMYTGTTHRSNKPNAKPHWKPYRGYRCPHNGVRPKYLVTSEACQNSHIPCKVLDTAVWSIVCQALFEPQVLLTALDEDATSERNRELLQHIEYLEREIARKVDDDERLLRAYMAGAFDEHEFSARRRMLKDEGTRMNEELSRLRGQVMTPEQLERRKADVIALSKQLQAEQIPIDPPFELKQRIIKLIVDEILLNVSEGWLLLTGAIRGRFPIVNTFPRRGSSPGRAESSPET